ncbi:MAG TPA: polysaccharide deacetylase family protein, partial [Humibacillus xanthopallidus]|nr:polysaccharide deacetylase family protein [Humibacillus xanthopallidus]
MTTARPTSPSSSSGTSTGAVGGARVDPAAVAARFARQSPARWGTSMPGISEKVPVSAGAPTLALTFDACGGPGGAGYDAALITALRAHDVPATLFLNRRWLRENPGVARDLVSDPLFAIGNHGTAHRPLS